MKCVGVDFSLTCPSIAIFDGDVFSFDNCQFHFLTNRKKFELCSKQLHGYLHDDYTSNEERYDQLTNWSISKIPKGSLVCLEGYSFGSRASRLFDIGEVTGLLKHKLYKLNYRIEIIPPTVIKKFATGKGNADKNKMALSFQEENNRNLYEEFDCSFGKSPISDVIDSYYICKYGVENYK